MASTSPIGGGAPATASAPPPLNFNTKVSSDLPFGTGRNHPAGVIFISDSTSVKTPYNYWIDDISLWPEVVAYFNNEGFDTVSFCPFSCRSAFEQLHRNIPLQRDPILRYGTTAAAPAAASVSQHSFTSTPQRPPQTPMFQTPQPSPQTPPLPKCHLSPTCRRHVTVT